MHDTVLFIIELTEKDLYAIVTNDWIFYGEKPIIYVKKEHLTINNGIMENSSKIKFSAAGIMSLVDQEMVATQILNDGYIIANWDESYSTISSNADCSSDYEYEKLKKFNIKNINKKEESLFKNKELNQLKQRIYAIESLLGLDEGNKDYKTEKYYIERQNNNS